jgi:hypothetical protein
VGCHWASEGEFRDFAPGVPCGTTTTGRWDILTVANSFLTGEAMASGMMSVISGFLAVGTNGSETACLIVLMSSLCVQA